MGRSASQGNSRNRVTVCREIKLTLKEGWERGESQGLGVGGRELAFPAYGLLLLLWSLTVQRRDC